MVMLTLKLSVICWLCFSSSKASSTVETYSSQYHNYRVTSSSLSWQRLKSRSNILSNHLVAAGEVKGTTLYVCRADVRGRKVPGYLIKPTCYVELYGEVKKYKVYEVLVNVEGAAMLHWKNITGGIYEVEGAVGCDRWYIAKANDDTTGSSIPGKIDPTLGRPNNIILEYNGVITQAQDAYILTEEQPSEYQLNDIKFGPRKATITERRYALKSILIRNDEPTPQTKEKVVTAAVHYVVYWGRPKGTYTNTPSTIHDGNSTYMVSWAIQKKIPHNIEKNIGIVLPPNTEVEVIVEALERKTRQEYSGVLTAFYSDSELQHRVRAYHENIEVVEIRASYVSFNYTTKQKQKINKFILGPYIPPTTTTKTTTTPKSTTVATTTTITTTTTETPKPPTTLKPITPTKIVKQFAGKSTYFSN